jgi:RNA polymerase sigma factor (sigma-70 family)
MPSSDHSSNPAIHAGSEADPNAEALFARHLAEQAAQGDLAATQALLRHVTPTLKRVVVGVLGRAHGDVDDVVQQALIAVQGALPAFRGECHVAGYSSRIALRVALRARRRHKLDLFRRDVLARLGHDDEHGAPPSAEAEAERRRLVLRNLLEELPEEQADVLALRVMLGLSLEEVAQATGAPLNTVRSRVRLAKEALRRRIESTPELADLRISR